MRWFERVLGPFSSLVSLSSTWLKQSTASYCDLQTADSETVLVNNDGSLLSVIRMDGVSVLVGSEEFEAIQYQLCQSLQTRMSQQGHLMQVYFGYNKNEVVGKIERIFLGAQATAERLSLSMGDLFQERVRFLSKYCAHEEVYVVLWTTAGSLSGERLKQANKAKRAAIKEHKIPAFLTTQNIIAAIPELRESHDSFTKSFVLDMAAAGMRVKLLEVHEAVHQIRRIADPDFTDSKWSPRLPGDVITMKATEKMRGNLADVLWPSLARQVLPRDATCLNLKTVKIGDRIYSSVFIELFPKQVQTFMRLLSRTLQTNIPWRISFMCDSNGLGYSQIRAAIASVLTVTSSQNRLICDGLNLLKYINVNTDDAVVRLRVSASTWAPEGELSLLRSRAAMLAKAIEGWGSCDVSEVCGDPYQGAVSSMMGVTTNNPASSSIAPLSDVLQMMPFFRPASNWDEGAILFRSPDGKPWPYQPGSSKQTTWIDIFYARPGSGKSVLSNAINLAVCLSAGITRLPRIAIIDIGPSSSGLIQLLQDALPEQQSHLVAHHRLTMHARHSINPFDTQLGCRFPTPQERAFLVNFLTLLATPVASTKPYDGISDMAGLLVNELYQHFADEKHPNVYSVGLEDEVDALLAEIDYVTDQATSWWEVTDALFSSGFAHEAMLAQRHAMPVLADIASICRLPAITDLYGNMQAPTGESLIQAFSRMISSAVREYPIIAQTTQFDIGDARVVALDLDEVAKSGGDTANRQTAVMYMLARYVLARHFFLTDESVADMPSTYRAYHERRIAEIREDPKRIVFDEFHRTANAQSVRDQVVQDMREGRKWKVQIALLSQSLDDFDSVMVEFATSIFIMEAGPEQAVRKTAEVFGLSGSARRALRNHVHGPREEGSTFLAQFATKDGPSTQLLTSTLGPVELWALNTTADDVNLRTRLYRKLGGPKARQLLAYFYPSGSAVKEIERLYAQEREASGFIDDDVQYGIIESLSRRLIDDYRRLQAEEGVSLPS